MKSTVNKTIPFKQRNEDNKNVKSKYKINSVNSKNTFRVIPYPRYKKKKEKGIKIIKKNKTLIIILGLIMFFGLIFFLDNVVLKDKLNTNSNMQVSSAVQNVSEKEFLSYSPIINNKIKNVFNVADNDIKTQSMHKNGNTVYAQGNISNEGEVLFFDVVLKNKQLSSLVVDGDEYIN